MRDTQNHTPHPANPASIGKILKNGVLFLVLAAVTFFFVFRDTTPGQIGRAIMRVNPFWLILGVLCMLVFVLCQGSNIAHVLRLFGYRVPLLQGVKYSMIGFFFSSVTPSSTGGQPMQMYYMHKDHIEMSHSALALLIELASFQSVTVTFSLTGFALQYRTLVESVGAIKWLVFVGVALNTGWLVLLLLCIFTKNTAAVLMGLLMRLMRFFRLKKVESICTKVNEQLEEYREGVVFFRKNKGAIVRIVLTTCMQIIAWHSVPYWVYKSFGLNAFSAVSIISMQAVLYITGAALPLPGGVGISESGFLALFRTLFPVSLLDSAMLLSRGVSFYLPLLLNGISVAVFSICRGRVTQKLPDAEENVPGHRNVS